MPADESIAEFNVEVLDLANKSFTLDEEISDTKLVRKVLTSLPSCFDIKVTTIEEANDIHNEAS
ncbi:gag-pol polyprotein [Cucumis melo var. makuwa]|nr:gag-pol polyprotein [Cucumis melo var. makuwa]